MGHQQYKEFLVIDAATLERVNAYLSRNQAVEDARECDVLQTFTVRFKDGCEADLKICNGDSGPYLDPVLFDPDGGEIAVLEPHFDQINPGKFRWEMDDGRSYCIQVRLKAADLLIHKASARQLTLYEVDVHRTDPKERTYARVRALIDFDHGVFLERLQQALTRWVRQTETGRKAWAYCCEDFNIGDLSVEPVGPGTELGEFLAESGIFKLNIWVNASDSSHPDWTFDTVLVDELELWESTG